MLLIIFVKALITNAVAVKLVSSNSPPPVTDVFDILNPTTSFPLTSTFSLNLSKQMSEFGDVLLLERKTPAQGNLIDDYASNPDLYSPCSFCVIHEPHFNLEYHSDLPLNRTKILSYAFDLDGMKLFLFTNTSSLLSANYEMNSSNIAIVGTIQTLMNLTTLEINRVQMHYVGLLQTLYLFSQKGLHGIDMNQTKLILNPIAGFQGNYTTESTVMRWYGLTFHVLIKPKTLKIFFITDKLQCTEVQTVSHFNNTQIFIADILMVGSSLWILDQQFGLYTFVYKDSKYIESQAYQIPYGKKLSIYRTDSTFQLTFELNKQIYIAELHWNETTKEMFLNRFYEQIVGVKSITFIDELLVVIGEVEMMVIRHSAHRSLIQNKDWQFKQFYLSFDVIGALPVKYQQQIGDAQDSNNTISDTINSTFLIVIKQHKIEFLTVPKRIGYITCNPIHQNDTRVHSIYIQLNQTTINESSPAINRYHRIRHSISFNVTGSMLSNKTVNSLSISIHISLSLFIICVVGSYVRHHRKKKRELQQLRAVLKRKMAEIESNQAPVQNFSNPTS